jgi:hypothetical protein
MVLAGHASVRAAEQLSGTDVKLDGIHSRAPGTWIQERSRGPRIYQFRVPRAEGDAADAEVVVFYFGPGQGGSPHENIKRWKGMFEPPSGRSVDDVAHVEEFKVGNNEVTYLDIYGTYKFKARPIDTNVELKPGYRMLAAVFDTKQAAYFFRMVGPEKTVSQHKQDFEAWLKGFK